MTTAADAASVRAALDAVPPDVARWSRPPRAALFLPVLRALAGPLRGLEAIDVGAGDPLLLASAIAGAGARCLAVDPALEGMRPPVPGVSLLAVDALDLPVSGASAPAPADLTVSSLFFGAPLRQRARRALRDRYLSKDRPGEDEVRAVQCAIETALVERLAGWTRPGGWSVHWSLESLFCAPTDAWRAAGFSTVVFDGPWCVARRSLEGFKPSM